MPNGMISAAPEMAERCLPQRSEKRIIDEVAMSSTAPKPKITMAMSVSLKPKLSFSHLPKVTNTLCAQAVRASMAMMTHQPWPSRGFT